MLRNILYPTDLSDLSKRGLAWITKNVLQHDSEIIVAHVVSTLAGTETSNIVEQSKLEVERMCEIFVPSETKCSAITMAGDRNKVLAEIARERNSSMAIVMTAPGKYIIPLVQALAIPQLVLRSIEEGLSSEKLLSNIVVATDLSAEHTDAVLLRLRKILLNSGISSRITLLHGIQMETPIGSQVMVNTASEALEAIRAEVETWNSDTRARLVSGQTELELPRTIEKIAPTLLVIGLPQKTDIWQLVLGNTAEALVDRTTCSILVIPTR